MNDNHDAANPVRLLLRTGEYTQPCRLLTDEDVAASRHADRIENMQLDLAGRVLGRTGDLLTRHDVKTGEGLAALAGQLAEALGDTLLIARSRGARLAGVPRARPDGTPPALPVQAFSNLPGCSSPTPHAFALLTFPGHDLASAPAARRYVRETARSWGLSPGTADDLETIAGELVANALEHSGSSIITLTCARTAETITISVIDEGRRGAQVTAPTTPPDPEREHGRGLLITEALARRWGSRGIGSGLIVWAEMATEEGGHRP